MNIEVLLPTVLGGLTMGVIYALVALGYNFIFQVTKVIFLAQGEFVSLCAFVFLGFSLGFSGLALWVSVVLTLLFVAFVSLFLERIFMRPATRRGIIAAVNTSMGLIFILEGSFRAGAGGQTHAVPSIIPEHFMELAGTRVGLPIVVMIGVLAIITLLSWAFFNRTAYGIGMRACAENSAAASLMGINTKQMVSLSYLMSGLMGAVGGFLISPLTGANAFNGLAISIKGFTATVLGSVGNIYAGVIAGLIIGLLEAFAATYVSSLFKEVVVYGLLIVMLLFRPTGIFGTGDVESF